MRAVVCIVVMLVGCVPFVHEPIAEKESAGPVWPATPSRPRLAFVMSFSGTEDLGIGKNFMQQFRELIGGPRQVRLVRPVAVVESSDNKVFVADPGVRGVHLFDLDRGRYQLIQGEHGQPLPSPVALAAGLSGEVYVTDSRLAAIFVIEPGKSEAVKVPLEALLARPTGLA